MNSISLLWICAMARSWWMLFPSRSFSSVSAEYSQRDSEPNFSYPAPICNSNTMQHTIKLWQNTWPSVLLLCFLFSFFYFYSTPARSWSDVGIQAEPERCTPRHLTEPFCYLNFTWGPESPKIFHFELQKFISNLRITTAPMSFSNLVDSTLAWEICSFCTHMATRCSAIAERPRCRVRYSFRQK